MVLKQWILSLCGFIGCYAIQANADTRALDIKASASPKECVVLLHGLARTSDAMSDLDQYFTEAGYHVVNYDYPSREFDIPTLASKHIPLALDQCGNEKTRVNFVTHSMGGILVRYYLEHNTLENLGRVVMLAPPNQGSAVVDNMKNVPGFKWLNGPAGLQLGTDANSIPLSLGAVTYEAGIIAGTSTINFILSQFLENPDDGKVSVESTKVKGMTDHLEVDVSHPFIMKDDEVIRQALYFIQHGQFDTEKEGMQ